jgi:hypothetical protein
MTTTRTPRCEINTRRHLLSHLREPRGRGGWLFETDAGEVVFSHQGTYAEARRAAIAWGTANGHQTLYTCP